MGLGTGLAIVPLSAQVAAQATADLSELNRRASFARQVRGGAGGGGHTRGSGASGARQGVHTKSVTA